jgi:hypothetical protein
MNVRLSFVALALLGGLALGALLGPTLSSAQRQGGVGTTAVGSIPAISDGPGGVWVLRGDQLYVCRLPVVTPSGRAALPPTPECGEPRALR